MPYPIPLFDEKILTLAPEQAIATGGARKIFIHPDNPNLCLKIDHSEINKQYYGKKKPLLHYFGFQTNNKEWCEENLADVKGYLHEGLIDRTQNDTDEIWKHLPRLHGWQKTNLGDGLIFDYYHKADGTPSLTLREVITKTGYPPELQSSVKTLCDYIKQNKFWIRDLHLHNILIADDGYLKLIDSIGTKTMRWKILIPLLRQYRIHHKIAKMKKRINKLIT